MVSVQPNMQGNDELSVLFSRNLTFNSETQTPRTEPSPVPAPSQPIVYSISQHYHHSAHAVKPKPQEQVLETPQEMQRPSSEPPQGGAAAVEHVLRTCGVDPTNLTPSQLQLFATADWPQQTRLIELWSICPPSNGERIPAQAWSSMSVQQEEYLAQLRYEKAQATPFVTSLQDSSVQSADGTWLQRSSSDSEPYMISGYEQMMQRESEQRTQPKAVYNHFGNGVANQNYNHATDPVFMGPDSVRQQEQLSMASQYGSFEQYRNGGAGDAMDVM